MRIDSVARFGVSARCGLTALGLCVLACLVTLGFALLSAAVAAATTAPVAATPQPSGVVVPLAAVAQPVPGVAQAVPTAAPSIAAEEAAASSRAGGAAPALSTYVDAGRRVELIGALVRGLDPLRLGVTVRVRASLDGSVWSPWFELEFPRSRDPAGSAFDRRDRVSEPAWVGSCRYVEVSFAGPAAPAAAVAARLRLSLVSSPWEESEVAEASGGASLAGDATPAGDAAPVDGASPDDGASASPDGTVSRMPSRPAIVTRSDWGANESWRNDGPYYGRVRMVFLHHTVSSNSYTQSEAKAIVRSVYYYHTRVNGWNDVGYNFLVDRYGTIYEGRYGGMTRSVIGAQTLGFNSSSTGVSMIGTFTSAKPPAAMVGALKRLLAWKLDVHHIDPLSITTVTCEYGEKFPKGAAVRFNVISGHRQANYTTCPGDGIYGQIGGIRSAVAALGQPKIYSPRAAPALFSPNGDGLRDATVVGARLSQPGDWKVEVRDDLGAVVRSFSGSGTTVAATWNGRDAAGADAPDGRYTVRITAQNATGTARAATLAVRRDSGAPSVAELRVAPGVVSPNGDGYAETALVSYVLEESCESRVLVFDDTGTRVRRVRDWSRAAIGTNRVRWDGTVVGDGARVAASDGRYRLRVEVRDAAGNVRTVAIAVTVNSTLAAVTPTPSCFSPTGDAVKDSTLITFRLARAAHVTVIVAGGGETLRTWSLGSLAAGDHQVRWDGAAGGATVASGDYAVVVTAVNGAGTVAVRRPVHVDRTRPRPATTATAATVRRGGTFVLSYSVGDAYSPSVRARIVVTDASGATVKAASSGWVRPNRSRAWSYAAATRGVFSVAVTAVDLAGNRQAQAARVTLTVK